MSFLNGIFGGPGGKNAPAAQPQSQPNPQQTQSNQQQPTGPGQVPGGMNANSQSAGPNNSNFQGGGNGGNSSPNPMDAWLAKLTGPSQQDQGGQQTPSNQQPPNQPAKPQGLFGDSLSPERLKQVVGNANFTANIPQEKVQAALSGDVNAFMEVMNMQAQSVMTAAIRMNAGLVEHGVKQGNSQFESGLDSRMRDFLIRNQNSQRPELQHPLAKSMLDAMKKQFAAANPTATPDDIHSMSEQFMNDLADYLSGAKNKATNQQNSGQGGQNEPDWTSFLTDGDASSMSGLPQGQQTPQQNQNFNGF